METKQISKEEWDNLYQCISDCKRYKNIDPIKYLNSKNKLDGYMSINDIPGCNCDSVRIVEDILLKLKKEGKVYA